MGTCKGRLAGAARTSMNKTIYVLSRNMKNIRSFYLKIFIFGGEIFSIFEKACFRNNILHIAIRYISHVHFAVVCERDIYACYILSWSGIKSL